MQMHRGLKGVYHSLSQIEENLHHILEVIVAVLMAVTTLDIIYQVLYRMVIIKFITIPSMFTEEFARYSIIWIMCLFLPICLKEGRFSAVTILIDRVHPRLKLAIYALVQLLTTIFVIVAFVYSFEILKSNHTFRSPSMQLPGIYIYSSIPVGMGLCLLQIAVECLGVFSGALSPFYNFETAEGKGGAD